MIENDRNAILFRSLILTIGLMIASLVGLTGCVSTTQQPDLEIAESGVSTLITTNAPEHDPLEGQNATDRVPVPSATLNPAEEDSSWEATLAACTETNPHPIGQSIAESYELEYDQVMRWFCVGYSFENILIALETSEAVDIPPGALLEMLLEKDWEEIWVEIGFVNYP
jgi:hypothetical protein